MANKCCDIVGCSNPRLFGFTVCEQHNKLFDVDDLNKSNTIGQPVEYKVLVLPDVVEEKTAGGIYLAQSIQEKEQMRAVKGTIIAVGGMAFTDWTGIIPDVGDRIIFAVNSGMIYKHEEKTYRLINDKDVVMILPKE